MAQTDKQQTDGHGDSMTDSVKIRNNINNSFAIVNNGRGEREGGSNLHPLFAKKTKLF